MAKSKNKKKKAAKKLLLVQGKINNALSTLLQNRVCVICSRELITEVSAYAATLESAESSNMDIGYCISCKSDTVQSKKFHQAFLKYPVLVNVMNTLPSIPTIRCSFNSNNWILTRLGLKTSYTIRYGVVDAIASSASVTGCNYFGPMDVLASRCPRRIVKYKDDVDFHLIIFKLNSNDTRFAALGALDLPSSVLIQEAKSRCHEFNKSGQRSGAATGFVFSNTNSHSLTPVTQKDTTEFVASPLGVASTVVYDNTGALRSGTKPPGTIIKKGIYNDMECMNRVSSAQKAKRVNSVPSYRSTLLAEMKSRIAFLSVAQELGLLAQDPFAKLGLFCNKFPHLPIEDILLEYACSTGEMSNYRALPAHTDGNKSHEVETLCYNGRVADTTNEKDANDCVKNWSPAFLYCCNAGVLFEISVGKNIMHCNLNKIMHVADSSRNDSNYSRASGPCGPHLDSIKFK